MKHPATVATEAARGALAAPAGDAAAEARLPRQIPPARAVPPQIRDAAEGGAVRPAWWPTSRFGRLRRQQRCDSFPEVIAEKVRRGHAAACATGRLDRKNALRPLDVTLPFVMVDTINVEQAIDKRKQAGLM